jgi:DNA-binding MarR family transcriptional regulator
MNENLARVNEELLGYQTLRLKDLIAEMIECCEDRKLYETRRFGLPYAELKCLMLFRGERYLTVKGIAQKLDVAKSRVTKLVEGLVQKGFLERISDPKDARIKLISVSPDGEQIARRIEAFHNDIHRQILGQMDDDERKRMLSYLETLRSAMEAVKERLV